VVRFIIVVYGAQSRFVRSKRNIVYLIIAIWVVFLIAKIPILIVHGVSFDPLTNRTECIISGRREGQQLFASFFVFAYALPLVIIAAFYLAIVAHVQREGSAYRQNRAYVKRRMGHVTRVTLLVVTVFAICWLPLHVHLLVGYYGHLPHNNVYGTLLIVWHCLAFANSTLNPIIYNVFSKDFRAGFMETLKLSQGSAVQTTSV
jgi:allatostatin receptor